MKCMKVCKKDIEKAAKDLVAADAAAKKREEAKRKREDAKQKAQSKKEDKLAHRSSCPVPEGRREKEERCRGRAVQHIPHFPDFPSHRGGPLCGRKL